MGRWFGCAKAAKRRDEVKKINKQTNVVGQGLK
jgi:hypothetical protein